MTHIRITNTHPKHAVEIHNLIRLWSIDMDGDDDIGVLPARSIARHIRRFPEGQFVVLDDEHVIGFAITMRTNKHPEDRPKAWLDAIGGYGLGNHDSGGEWLYGVEFFIHPDYRKLGIGTEMYRLRFELIQRLNLRGFYAGGMLMGYKNYYPHMDIREYAQKVMTGEIYDPTVSMQMNRGFRAVQLIENYTPDMPPFNHAMLIVWDNAHYKPLLVEVAA